MPSIIGNDHSVIVAVGTKLLISQNNNDECHVLDTDDLESSILNNSVPTDDDLQDSCGDISESFLSCAVSQCGQLLACTNKKQLHLWKKNKSEWTVVSSRSLSRISSKIIFSPSGADLVVADKSGDVYVYSVTKHDVGGQLIMGHLSMLLDVLITLDEKYIITCDRDEKIRVSLFPNAYHIHTYCLGHEEFVSQISLLPVHINGANLISSSGDGTLCLWNYKTGHHHHTILCKDLELEIAGEVVSEATENVIDSHDVFLGSKPNCRSVTNFALCKLDFRSVLLAVGIYNFNGCILFNIYASSENIKCTVVNILKMDVVPWDIHFFSSEALCVLNCVLNEPLKIMTVDTKSGTISWNTSKLDEWCKNFLLFVNNKWSLFKGIKVNDLVPTLYKRKLDNVQEYQERKKQRLKVKEL